MENRKKKRIKCVYKLFRKQEPKSVVKLLQDKRQKMNQKVFINCLKNQKNELKVFKIASKAGSKKETKNVHKLLLNNNYVGSHQYV